MSELHSVPIAVVSNRPDDAEAISQTLRNAGCIANCITLPDTQEFGELIISHRPLLLFIFEKDIASERFKHIIGLRNQHLPDVPVLAVQARVNEENIAAAMAAGARDLVSLGNKARLQAVAKREIRHCEQSRQLRDMEEAAQQLEEQLESLVKESPDALMYVHEGIIVSINPALLELLGHSDDNDFVGTPALDLIEESSHTAFKGALVACGQGKWSDHTLEIKIHAADDQVRPVLVELDSAVYDDEPCVRITMRLNKLRDQSTPQKIVSNSIHHPLTGFYRRQRFLSEMGERLKQPLKGGSWILAYVKPDNIHRVREQLGPISSDDLLLEFAKILQENVRNTDLYGQFGGDLFMVLMPRGTLRDATAWAENLRTSVNKNMFEIDTRSIALSCTIGLASYRTEVDDIADLVLHAQKAYQEGYRKGGDQVGVPHHTLDEEQEASGDSMYVKKIKTALMRDTFRLVFQPIASLDNHDQQLFDVLLRMTDQDNRELMPNVFLPAAKRNGLMKNIDRWVIANAIKFCQQQSPCQLFVRLSYDSIPDATLASWIRQQIESAQISPKQLIFQVTESDAENHMREVKALTIQLKQLRCGVAIEHFGVGSRPLQVLDHVPADFVKIDGSLMEGISRDKALQKKIRGFVKAASNKNIATVAERVEDANTMAVLWQIGFQYIQGFYVQGPEEIVLET